MCYVGISSIRGECGAADHHGDSPGVEMELLVTAVTKNLHSSKIKGVRG